ncbi:MAG: SDR family oxidoreductase [Pseudomonadales bacterium]|jgi:3(or 17)beta-hydroxysteroid dehydrogenase|nr:SDR family oxidoreductase [Pseudomonadales bacterium]
MGRVQDKVCIVTGAAQGLGAADARLLVAEGARVVLTDVNADGGAALAEELGDAASFIAQDVSDEASWPALVEQVTAEHGRLDVLVNNAGIAPIGTVESTDTATWRRTLAIHLDATYFGCHYALNAMKASGGGSIVNMSSTAALVGIPAYFAYSAAKGGIRALTKSVAIHCRAEQNGIRCNSVHPGSISTPMVHGAFRDLMGVDVSGEETRLKYGIGEPVDVAYMVLYLASDESKHVTGAEMVVDNGDTVV